MLYIYNAIRQDIIYYRLYTLFIKEFFILKSDFSKSYDYNTIILKHFI